MSLDKVLPSKADENDISAAAIKAIGVDTSAIDIHPDDKKPEVIKPSEEDLDDDDFEEEKPDMRSVLGFLN